MNDLTATRVLLPGIMGPYDALVDLKDGWNSYLRPLFTLATVREIAARTQVLAEECGSNDVVTAHVIDGDPGYEGEPRSVILTVNWHYWNGDKGAKNVTDILTPTEDGLYQLGGSSWCWEMHYWDCACREHNPWHLTTCPMCDQARELQAATPDGMVASRVIVDGLPPFEAYVPDHAGPGEYTHPLFTLNAVRSIAAHTQELAAQRDPRSAETIHLIETAPDSTGNRGAIVLHTDWTIEGDEGPADAARTVIPDANGLYRIGPDWHWSVTTWTCWCEMDNAWHTGRCDSCGRTRAEQPSTLLTAAVWEVAEILRERDPEATAAVVDLTGLARLIDILAGERVITGTSDDGPFDTETLGQADEVLRQALDQSTLGDLDVSGWQHVPDEESARLYRITFPATPAN